MQPAQLLLLAALGVAAAPEAGFQGRRPARFGDLEALIADRRAPLEERFFALEQLAALEAPVDLEALAGLKNYVRGPWVADYVRCLGRTGSEGLAQIERYLGKRQPDSVRAEAVYARSRYEETGGEAFARSTLRDRELPAEMRVAALAGLAHRGSPFARIEALRRLAVENGPVLLMALQVLRHHGTLEDAPYLIDVLEEHDGRAANEAVRLLQRLTGYRVGRDPKSWKYWMLRHRMEGTPFRREVAPGEDEITTLSYLGIPILGNKVIFVLDSSGSMQQRLHEQFGETRGSRAVEELVRLLPQLPGAAAFDIVFFESAVSAFADDLVPKSSETVERATAWLRQRVFAGGTNVFGALELALERGEVEEIFILSDGEPTAGEITDPTRILARAARWNRFRMVRINAISLGAPMAARDFLCRLAQQNDGVCRVID